MSYARVEKSGAVSTVVLNRPERLNAISGDLLDDLHRALVEVNSDESCNVIVFTGAGRAFCAGDDLKEFSKQTESDASILSHVERIQQITRDLMFNGKPVVGAVHGFAVGGGFEWLLNCDLVVASDDLVCFFPEMEWGRVRHRRSDATSAAKRGLSESDGALAAWRTSDSTTVAFARSGQSRSPAGNSSRDGTGTCDAHC